MKTQLHRPGGVLLAGVLVSSVFAFMPAAHAADGTVSGTVTGPGGNLEGISVKAWVFEDDSWVYSDAAGSFDATDATGSYTLTLPAGPYRIGFDDSEGAHVGEFYDDAATVESAQTVTVGGVALDLDAELATASHVTGTVDGPDGLPLEFASVAAYQEFSDEGRMYWQAVEYADTDGFGNYDIGGLAPGRYRIGFDPDESGLAEEFYNDKAAVLLAEDVTAPAVGIDAQLAEASQITGTVTGASNELLAGAYVYAYVKDGGSWDYARDTAEAVTDANGQYTLDGLAAGTYRILFEMDMGADWAYEAWNNKGRIEEGDDIIVASDVTVTGKDAQLVVGEHDPKYLDRLTQPTLTGTPQVGSTLTGTPGTYMPVAPSVSFRWIRNDEAIPGATASTYTLTAADQGMYIAFVTVASAPGYEDDYNGTEYVGPVVAAPIVVPAPVPAPAPVPVISFSKKIDVVGALTVGSTLKLKKYKALVTQAAATATYKIQWFAGSKKIKKATKPKLLLKKALKGKKISVKVTAKAGTTTKTVKVKVGKVR